MPLITLAVGYLVQQHEARAGLVAKAAVSEIGYFQW
jgi:hypothetical protein